MKVVKTIKLYIDGNFPRTESGRSYVVNDNEGNQMARLCQASRKDFRNAVSAAKNACAGWANRDAYNRSQILYRMAEMTEGKRSEFSQLFSKRLGIDKKSAEKMVDQAISTFIYYAGFADKFEQVIGAVNPVSGPFHNFTSTQAVGVVALIEGDSFHFANLVDYICSIIVSGNSTVVLLGQGCPAVLAPLAEVFATSDLPAGVVNLLTGQLSELEEVIATHREVRSISFKHEDLNTFNKMKALSANNMKRMVGNSNELLSLNNITDFVEYKSVWHPAGI